MQPSGRGAAMLRYLQSKQQAENENEAAQPERREETEERSERETISGVAVARPTGRGRSRLLQLDTDPAPGVEQPSTSQRPSQVPTSRPPLLPTPRQGLLPTPSGQGLLPTPKIPLLPTPGQGLMPTPHSIQHGYESLARENRQRPDHSESVSVIPRGRGQKIKELLSSMGEQKESKDREPVKPQLPPPEKQLPPLKQTQHSGLERKFAELSTEETRSPVVKTGTSGRPLSVVCNYITLSLEPGCGVYEYVISFDPQEDSKGARLRMLGQHLQALGGTKNCDGWKLLLPILLPDKLSYFECSHPVKEHKVTMTITFRRKSPMTECADLYNMLFRRIMIYLGLKDLGRKFFDPSGAISVPQHKLEVWPGYVTNVSEFEGGLHLCCDASHRVMRCDSALDLMKDIARKHGTAWREESKKALLGSVVLTRYNNKTYKVDDVDWEQSPMSSFQDAIGNSVGYCDYYKQHYDIEIRDKNQPLLISRVKRRKNLGDAPEERMVCLIPELCYITGLTDSMRADFRVMKDLTQKLQLTPQQRYEGLCRFLRNVSECEKSQELLRKWKLRLDNLPVKLQVRVVDSETLKFQDGVVTLPPGNTNWNVRNRLLQTVHISNWVILYVQQDHHIANEFARNMKFACQALGMQMTPPRLVKVADNRNESLMSALRSCLHDDLKLVVVFFSSVRADKYTLVKKMCCVEKSIPSQVIQSKTLSRPEKARSIVQKIAMQINCKLGGSLWSVTIPYPKLMVCGIDVYHGNAGGGKSALGFVAALDPLQTQWFSRVEFSSLQNQEIGNSLRCFMNGAVNAYFDANGFYPDRIIVFRDGVGDGQLHMAAEFEVPQMIRAFADIHDTYKPKFTVVVCQKRIMTRVFAQSGQGLRNPDPGTVVDHTVTRFKWFDFFLVSQSSNRGTVSPSHYIVVHDDGDIKPDHIQRLAYKMTHLYYNWTGTVSVPAPCLYAHRLAQLAGEHLHKAPHRQLTNKLFFL